MKTILVTTTFYRSIDEIRFVLACVMMEAAAEAGYQIIVIDGSPDPAIAEKFRNLGALVFTEQTQGMGNSRRTAFFFALNYLLNDLNEPDSIILWLEPEKVDLIRWIEAIVQPIEDGTATVVVPARSEESWNTYPGFQAKSEKLGNMTWQQTTGFQLDVFFGPVAFLASKLRQVFLEPPPAFDYPDTYIQQFLVLLLLMKQRLSWASVEIDFNYPQRQREIEEEMASHGGTDSDIIRKRQNQLRWLTEGFTQAAKKIQDSAR